MKYLQTRQGEAEMGSSVIDLSIKLERITGSHEESRFRIITDGKYLEYKDF